MADELSLTEESTTEPAATPEPAASPETETTDHTKSWLDQIDPELAKEKSLQDITDLNNLVKSYINSQKLIGKDASNKISIPDEFGTDEDWKQVYKKLGLPEKVEDYKAELSETEYFDEAFKKDFLKQAHEAGVLPKQAKAMFEFFNSQTDEAVKTQQSEYTKQVEEQVTKLKEEWGAGFAKEFKVAQAAFRQFADEGLIEQLKEAGLDSNPTLIRLMNKVGKNLNEDTFSRQSVAHLGTSKDEAVQEHGKIMGDMTHPYWNGDHPNHKSAVDRMLKLQEIINSTSAQA